ncbi:MAG: DUF192 domain-containing protein [Deltaproteobacteria bacterium]|nr:DUF192 domain-containing protein [Deltaproteobacteria bacterium]
MPGLISLLAVLGLSLFALRAAGCSKSESGLPVITVDVGGKRVRAEIASTDAQRARGLMYRRSMGKNDGMLFVYPTPEPLSFWMKNTYLPLSIAYIDTRGAIVHIEDMKPLTTNSHPSPKPVPYALEMNKGWFEKNGIDVGAKVTFELPNGVEVSPR